MRLSRTLLTASLLAAITPAMAAQHVDLNNILSMQSSTAATADAASSGVTDVRQKAVFQAAETYAAQVAYCHEAKVVTAFVDRDKGKLDAAYDFANLLLDGGRVLPPVIEQVDASYRQHGDDEAITAQTTWHILSPARIVSAAPNWRNYLYLVCTPPLRPDPVLLPGGAGDSGSVSVSADEKAWKAGARKGWKLGIAQANEAYDLGLHRMTRDYAGMLRFAWLDSRGVVSTPILARGQVGVKVDGHTLSVGETVFRLTQGADWRPQRAWRPVISDGVTITR